MDDLTNVTLDMLINIYKTSLDYLTNGPRGPLTYNLTFKSSLESIHCIYLRMDLQFTIFRLMLFHFVCFRHSLGKHFLFCQFQISMSSNQPRRGQGGRRVDHQGRDDHREWPQ